MYEVLESTESLKRPAWTSEEKTGNFEAYRHKHTYGKSVIVLSDYYEKSGGLK